MKNETKPNSMGTIKPKPFKHLFSTGNFTSILLNCFVLEHSDFKTIEKCTSKVTSTELMLKWLRLKSRPCEIL